MKPAFCDIVAELDMEDVIRLLDVLKNMDLKKRGIRQMYDALCEKMDSFTEADEEELKVEENKKGSSYKTYIHEIVDDITDEEFLKKIYSLLVLHTRKEGRA